MRKIKTPAKHAKPAIDTDTALPAVTTKPTIDLAAKQAANTLSSTLKYLARATYPVGEYTGDNGAYLAFFACYAKSSPVLSISAFYAANKKTGLNVPGYTVRNFRARARLLCGLQLLSFCDASGKPQAFDHVSDYVTFTDRGKTDAGYTAAIAATL